MPRFGSTFDRKTSQMRDCSQAVHFRITIHNTIWGPKEVPSVVFACENHRRHLESFGHLAYTTVRI